MPVLNPSEYNISYFDGRKATLKHNAGYTEYRRWYRNDGVDSLGEFWKDKAKDIFDKFALSGKKVLEVGCAKGFVTEDLRSFGANAYGLDVSSYAVGEATAEVAPYLTVGDARTSLSGYAIKEFDFLFSLRFLECIADADLDALITEMNRISKAQYHTIDEFSRPGAVNAKYYNPKPLTSWLKYKMNKGTKLVSQEDDKKTLTK